MQTRRSIICSLVALAMPAGRPAWAGADPSEAASFIAGLGQATIAVLAMRLPVAQREQRLRALLHKGFDLAYLSRLALGRAWRDMTPSQRAEFQAAFEEWVLRTYAARLGTYAGQSFTVLGAGPTGDDATVRTEITGSGPAARIDWRVRSGDGGAKIIDLVVEGVSMVVTHRAELQDLVQRQGIAGLIGTLRERAAAQPS